MKKVMKQPNYKSIKKESKLQELTKESKNSKLEALTHMLMQLIFVSSNKVGFFHKVTKQTIQDSFTLLLMTILEVRSLQRKKLQINWKFLQANQIIFLLQN